MTGKKWIWIAVGLLAVALLACGGLVGTVTYVALRHMRVQDVSAESAEQEFSQLRARFAEQKPLIEIDEDDWGHPRIRRLPPESVPKRPETMHILAWNERESKLVKLDLPLWILRFNLRGNTITFPSDRFENLDRLNLTAEDIERNGPGLILDHRGRRGERVLIWTE